MALDRAVDGTIVHDDIAEVLISEDQINRRVSELAAQITVDYAEKSLLLIGVLKGAVVFLVDLARQVHLPLEFDFMAISSYGQATTSSGVVRILKDLDRPIAGKHILVVEDIVDSGLTLQYITRVLATRDPASVRICGLLVKEKARSAEVRCDYVGFHIGDEFVVGYGLDFAERYRNLPYVGLLQTRVYSE